MLSQETFFLLERLDLVGLGQDEGCLLLVDAQLLLVGAVGGVQLGLQRLVLAAQVLPHRVLLLVDFQLSLQMLNLRVLVVKGKFIAWQ